VEKDKVFAIFQFATMPSHPAVAPYLIENKVLDIFAWSGEIKDYYPKPPFAFSGVGGVYQLSGLAMASPF